MPPLRIIITDHDAFYLEMMHDLLTEEGYQVECILGDAPFDVIHALQPDLVLLEISITNTAGGWHTLDMLRRSPYTRRTPVLLCSTDALMLRENAARLAQLDCDTLEKPFDIALLLGKIRAMIGCPSAKKTSA
jgi:DNA-binding response OmpR family regulator